MHITEGVLKPEIIIPASIISGAFLSYLIVKLKSEDIPKVAVLSAMFFIASFIHVPVGISSIHLILSGLLGAFLGLNAILAMFVALFLQALLFGYGGISVLGVNLLVISLPALLGRFFLRYANKTSNLSEKVYYFLVGFVPILLSSILLSIVLILNGEEFFALASFSFISNLALMVLEGIISLFALIFIKKVNKDLLKC